MGNWKFERRTRTTTAGRQIVARYVTDTGVLYGNVFEPPAPFVQNQGQWESPELYRRRVGGKHSASDALQIR